MIAPYRLQSKRLKQIIFFLMESDLFKSTTKLIHVQKSDKRDKHKGENKTKQNITPPWNDLYKHP